MNQSIISEAYEFDLDDYVDNVHHSGFYTTPPWPLHSYKLSPSSFEPGGWG
jgi:hypothetical protein